VVYCVYRHFQQYFSYTVAVGFIGGGKQDTGKKSLKFFFYVTYWIGNFIISETFQILLILNLITSSVKKK